MLSMLGKNLSRRHFILKYFSHFTQKTGFDISCKLSPAETICMTYESLFSGKNTVKPVLKTTCIKQSPLLTLVLLNPDMPCLDKQCRSRSVGFWRSQLIWIYIICHLVCKFVSIAYIKQSDWLTIRSGHGILIYSWQGLRGHFFLIPWIQLIVNLPVLSKHLF